MFDRYYVTGGTGFLGRAVLQKLAGAGAAVRALVLPGDPLLPLLFSMLAVQVLRQGMRYVMVIMPAVLSKLFRKK